MKGIEIFILFGDLSIKKKIDTGENMDYHTDTPTHCETCKHCIPSDKDSYSLFGPKTALEFAQCDISGIFSEVNGKSFNEYLPHNYCACVNQDLMCPMYESGTPKFNTLNTIIIFIVRLFRKVFNIKGMYPSMR